MNALFLCAALALPSAMPYHAVPLWEFRKEEVAVIKMLRDYGNGETASRPHKWILIYGQHPHWVWSLTQEKIKVIGMWKKRIRWPSYIMGKAGQLPFAIFQFQVYIYDAIEQRPFQSSQIIAEANRVVSPWGFFLYRPAFCPEFGPLLTAFGWSRFKADFHDFAIWHRRDYFRGTRAA